MRVEPLMTAIPITSNTASLLRSEKLYSAVPAVSVLLMSTRFCPLSRSRRWIPALMYAVLSAADQKLSFSSWRSLRSSATPPEAAGWVGSQSNVPPPAGQGAANVSVKPLAVLAPTLHAVTQEGAPEIRSEERRVGKECRS